ncbi:MAG TPA: helix-turn-helix transcriptional regulator [Aestuariivirga sp.]|jgi:transcriptional regulator with XRE-family HTH domain
MTRRDPNYIDVHVGSRIRMRRQIVSMSQEKLGEMLGITFQQVQKYEKGSNRISASRLFYAAKILGVPVQAFFEDLPGSENDTGFNESNEQNSVMSSLMNAEGIQLAKAFRDADNTTKRKLIATLARCIVDMKD